MPINTSIDSLTTPTLKHLRERWWNDEFTEFLAETLRPRPGNRILDVGCGEGLAEVSIGRLHLSQIRLAGVDNVPAKVAQARRETAAHNQRAWFAAGDAVRLPFTDGAFDSTYCVAVLQHVRDVEAAVGEFARVTREGGRIVAVEPDNAARYTYSSVPAGAPVFEAVRRVFGEAGSSAGESTDPVVGPKLAERFARHGIEPVEVRVFPVSNTFLGPPPTALWQERRQALERVLAAGSDRVKTLAGESLALLAEYEKQATATGEAFVEIQSTPLFATVGQREDR
jgi:ubiquinone/menaquinone biosynthesis C-methylase UbiE